MSLGKGEGTSDPSSIWGVQAPYLSGLYERGLNTLAAGGGADFQRNMVPGAIDAANYAGRVSGIGAGAQGTLSGGGIQDPNLWMRTANIGSMQTPGLRNDIRSAGDYQDPRLDRYLGGLMTGQSQNQYLGREIQAGLGDISRNFRENIMPGINIGAAGSNVS